MEKGILSQILNNHKKSVKRRKNFYSTYATKKIIQNDIDDYRCDLRFLKIQNSKNTVTKVVLTPTSPPPPPGGVS